MQTKVPIKNDDVLSPGDVVELNFTLTGPSWLWLQATESALIESRLKAHYNNFTIQSWEWTDNDTNLAITIKITAPPVLDPSHNVQEAGVNITAVVICATIMTAAIVYWFTQGTTFKIVQTATPAISLIAVAAIGYFALQLFGKGVFAKT